MAGLKATKNTLFSRYRGFGWTRAQFLRLKTVNLVYTYVKFRNLSDFVNFTYVIGDVIMPVTIDGEEYFRTSEAAEHADVTTATIALWCRKKRIECRKRGTGRWLIRRSSLEEFMRGRRQTK